MAISSLIIDRFRAFLFAFLLLIFSVETTSAQECFFDDDCPQDRHCNVSNSMECSGDSESGSEPICSAEELVPGVCVIGPPRHCEQDADCGE
ncbi:MAG: hypothetical protein JXA30_12210, partial [Deltaproteobacteria bacterium]|nr:hypothetical protein [Deltaproteobacteria bacterium]